MNLFHETRSLDKWLSQILIRFMHVRPWTTLAAVLAAAVSKVSRVLAFVLPLKVIILAGSEGVPRYFRFFITNPDHRLEWIIGLTLAAVLFYILTLVLEVVSVRLSHSGGCEVLQSANDMTLLSDQEEVIQNAYATVCQVCANLLFAVTGIMVGLFVLNSTLFLFLLAIVATQYLFTAWVVSGPDTVNPGRLQRHVLENTKNYLDILATANFLLGFLIILATFLTGAGGNILLAIISFIALRQILAALKSMIRDAAKLYADQHQINALVFRHVHLEAPEARDSQTLRDLFHKEARQQRTTEELDRAGLSGEAETRWLDCSVPGLNTVTVTIQVSGGAPARRCLQQIFSPKSLHHLRNEHFLFTHVPRARFKAPEVLTQFIEGPFQCQICGHGQGQPVPKTAWPEWEKKLLLHMWSCMPPHSLVQAFMASKPMLQKRLSVELLERLSVAVDNDTEAGTLQGLQQNLDLIRVIIKAMPLYIHNPDINHGTVVQAAEDDVLIPFWARWSLEPIGVQLPGGVNAQQVNHMLDQVREQRDDIPAEFGWDQIQFLQLCRRLEASINRGAYKAALNSGGRVLGSPLMSVGV